MGANRQRLEGAERDNIRRSQERQRSTRNRRPSYNHFHAALEQRWENFLSRLAQLRDRGAKS
jgi:hypothetical protein